MHFMIVTQVCLTNNYKRVRAKDSSLLRTMIQQLLTERMTHMDKPRNFKIENVELNYARIGETPIKNNFGATQWELQIVTADKEQAQMLKDNHFNVKNEMVKQQDGSKTPTGRWTVSLKRKAMKADGTPMDKPRVVDAELRVMEESMIRTLGNGSVGNVIVWQNPYSYQGRSGISNSLTAVQVTEFKEYKGASDVDFDVISGSAPETAAAGPEVDQLF